MAYDSQKTLVILMGFSKLPSIVHDLLRAGWPGGSAIAVICSGTMPHQKVVSGTLSNIASHVNREKRSLTSPGMIVVGNVVKLREKIGNF
jgi:siroheme synthase